MTKTKSKPEKIVKPKIKTVDHSMEIHELSMRLENLEDRVNKISNQIGGFYDYDIREMQEKLQKVLNRMGL